jgi:hypothetical protein
MFQLDDQFLQSVGLGQLPDDQKQAFLQHTYETLEERVGMRLASGLSEAQLEEFEGFAAQDEQKTYAWLSANVPDYQNHDEYKQLADSAPEGVTPLMVAAEYASVKWLEINSPNYRQVVAEELTKLRDEIIASKDKIGQQSSISHQTENDMPRVQPTPQEQQQGTPPAPQS